MQIVMQFFMDLRYLQVKIIQGIGPEAFDELISERFADYSNGFSVEGDAVTEFNVNVRIGEHETMDVAVNADEIVVRRVTG